jgi:hypothetical protein
VFDRVIELFVNKAPKKEIELLVDIDAGHAQDPSSVTPCVCSR